MKKLLLLGALLVIGTSSFALDQTDDLGSVDSTTANPGQVGLNLMAKGSVTASTAGNATLIIEPVDSSEPIADTIVFDFTDLTLGSIKTTTGSFRAQILENSSGTILAMDLSKIQDKLSAAFVKDLTEVAGNVVTTDVKVPQSGGVDGDVGTLTYTLNTTFPDNNTFFGTIDATIDVSDSAATGTFADNSVDVIVKVNQSTDLKPGP